MKFHCVSCNRLWGEGEFFHSSGVCPLCFMKWVNVKKRSIGKKECYGEFGRYKDVDCTKCSLSKLCLKDTYEIKQSILWGFEEYGSN